MYRVEAGLCRLSVYILFVFYLIMCHKYEIYVTLYSIHVIRSHSSRLYISRVNVAQLVF